MEEFFAGLGITLSGFLPTLLAAIAVLVVGWLLAVILSSLTRSLLRRTTLDDRIAGMLQGSQSPRPEQIQVERWVGAAVFWLVIFLTIVAFLQVINLTAISTPMTGLLNEILAFIPSLISALLLLLIAWVIASILRLIVTRLVNASGAVRRLSEDAQIRPQGRATLGQTLGTVVYWLVFLFFLPAILDALNLQGIMAPVQAMVNEILGFLPNLLGAVIIFLVGWLVARILRQIVTSLLAGFGLDNLLGGATADDLGETTTSRVRLSEVIGIIVYVLVMIPVFIAALNALDIPAISQPASNMLNDLLTALPAIFGAVLLIALAYFIGRIAGRFVASILTGLGFNRIFEQIGFVNRLQSAASDAAARARTETAATYPATTTGATAATGSGIGDVTPGRTTPAEIVGYIVMIAIVLFATMEGASLLGFETLAALVSAFIVAATQVLVGLIIFGIGLYLSAMAERVIRESDMSQANILAPAARIGIIVFSAALALRQMGIAESIVNLAFGLLLGAVAVAAALAFGLGGRETANRLLERWQRRIDSGGVIPATGREPQQNQPRPDPFNPSRTPPFTDTDLDDTSTY